MNTTTSTVVSIAAELGINAAGASEVCFEHSTELGHIAYGDQPLDNTDAATARRLLTAALADERDAMEAAGFLAPAPFVAGYDQADARVWRRRLHVRADGTASVTFRGQIADVTTSWVGGSRRAGTSLFAEVTPDDTSATRVTVAFVPTGKRIPLVDGSPAPRLGEAGPRTVYLLAVDGTVDRAAYDAEKQARRDLRAAERAAAEAQAFVDAADDDDAIRGMSSGF